jgi:Peptidase family M28
MRRYVFLTFAAVAGTLFAADYAAEGNLWWAHVQALADDSLAGRDTGSAGFQKAVEYVSSAFERIGLKPAGKSGYLQPVAFETRRLEAARSSLALVRNGKAEPLSIGQDANLNLRGDPAASVEAPMVFAGYGMAIPEAGYDDTAGLDLRGKIAVYVNAQPPVEASGNVKSHYSSAGERWKALRKAGAIGIGVITVPRGEEAAGRGGRGAQTAPPAPLPTARQFVLANRKLQEAQGQKIAITITRAGAAKFFAASGHTFAEIETLARENKPLPKFPMGISLRAKLAVVHEPAEAPNVVGLFEGSDPQLKHEYVVMSAHLDHVGIGRPVNGDSIYNGAMDDASGIASVLEIARLMKETGAHPKRSIIFLAVTAEEKGELGSRYFAAHPTVPFQKIVADINLDMFLPLYALKVIEVPGLAESTLGDQVAAAARDLGVAVQTDREPDQNRFIRSDQYSFIRRGVPSLAFKFGYEFGSPEEKTRKAWVRDRYHKPSDDLEQPVDRAAAAEFDRVILGLLERVADDPARPQWKSDSFFKRFVSPSF